ncbi:30S ribosomal protein S2 [bacterium]|jgi:small subunit ribosomal protein S2|nr:30S ribosomal protein S2 [bacterium]MBT6832197.1 30S ribosomal protein S2 [bacterium]MBT6996142.1 30S ribosomal protein S2 [bacterium]MBT7772222.1 30S ribosomal protein S2 [bacterium]
MTDTTTSDKKPSVAPKIDLKTLMDAELHIGQRTSGWNPKMKKFLHSDVNGVHVFDLEKTMAGLEKSMNFLKAVKLQGKRILFVGTKPQTALILNEVLSGKAYFSVDQKWQPGLLTNFKEIRKRIDHYLTLKMQFETGEIQKYTKKEISHYKKELEKLSILYHGVGEMRKLPGVVVVLDGVVNRLAIEESRVAKIPVVTLLDSNANPDGVDFPIPGNDDSVKSIRFVLETLLQSVA